MAIQVPAKNGWTLTKPEKWDRLNPKGRPKKGISLFIQQCGKEGIKPARKADIEATYMTLLNMDATKLAEVFTDEKQPVIVKKLAMFINNTKKIDDIEKILDRWIGKAVQRQEIAGEGWKDLFQTLARALAGGKTEQKKEF